MKGRIIVAICVLIFGVFMNACENNIFEGFHITNENDFDECMSMGNAAYNSSNFEEAQTWYENAVAVRPNDSDARYGLAKAYMRLYNVDVFTLANTLANAESHEDILASIDVDTIISIFNGTSGAQQHTQHIAVGNCTTGKITPLDIKFDYEMVTNLFAISAIANALKVAEQIQDATIVFTSTGIAINNWDQLDSEQQQSITDQMNTLADSIDAAVSGMPEGDSTKESLEELAEQIRNIGG